MRRQGSLDVRLRKWYHKVSRPLSDVTTVMFRKGCSMRRDRFRHFNRSPFRVGIVSLALLLIVAGSVVAVSIVTGSQERTASASSPPGLCTRGMPPSKCESIINAVRTANAQPSTAPSETGTSSTTLPFANDVPCGPGFFGVATEAELTAQFGYFTCELISPLDAWLLIGSGTAQPETLTTAPDGSGMYTTAPGGSIIGVDRCGTTDTNCLDPNIQHTFGEFTVYYPPDPSTNPLQLVALDPPDFAAVINASCGEFYFDISNGDWYPDVGANINGSPTGVTTSTPLPTTGAEALSAPAPSPINTSCTWR